MRTIHWLAAIVVTAAAAVIPAAAQTQTSSGNAVGGVAITTEGLLHIPRTSVAHLPLTPQKNATLVYISLPHLLADAKALVDAGRPLPPEIRFLHGLTQIQYLFAFPQEHDLVIAGPAETVRADNPLEPVGAASGRPVLQFDDLAVVFRALYSGGGNGGRGRDFFGCSIDPAPGEIAAADALVARYGADRQRLLEEMHKAIGPEQVKIFGVPEDSRVALTMVAADYRLKRLSMGLEIAPGIGSALGSSGAGRFWFRPSYDPLLVSRDGLSYAFRGKRLEVSVGEIDAQTGPVPPSVTRFSKQFTDKMDLVAGRVDAVADLQNITDLFLLAAIVRQDGLATRTGTDLSWLLAADKFHVASVPVPRTAETLITVSGDELARGGVAIAGRGMGRMARGNGDAILASVRRRPTDSWCITAPLK
ncbi:MAG TPA: DUF1598 domain-containing protein [Phycisphaerae bacterium]|nr:DUF1598 domain-containing protein [Phycisphaerae bacterium]